MSEVDRLLSEYKAAHGAGSSADPRPYLERVEGRDRELLAGLIDAYLEAAPRRAFDAEAFRTGPASVAAEGTFNALAGAGGMWPAVLPRLRNQARIRRSDLVSELAARLGAESRQDKVELYYHQMEQGLLPEPGVSDTVLDALGKIVGWSADALRKAGQMPQPGPPRADAGAVFARSHMLDTVAAPPASEAPAPAGPQEWDEVDRLFRGEPPSA